MFRKKPKASRRQLAGQNSKAVYLYYTNARRREEKEPNRIRQSSLKTDRPKFAWLKKTPTYLALIALIICFGYVIGVNTNPKIVQIAGNQKLFLRDKNTYQTAANKIINRSILNFNKITFNSSGIGNELKKQFPELSEVSITLPIINRRPVVYVNASPPAFVLVARESSVVIDDRGVAVLPTSQVPHLTSYNLPTVNDQLGLNPNVGKSVLPGSSVKFIKNVIAQFKNANQPVDQIILPSVVNEVDLKLKGKDFIIKMDLQGDSREQSGAFIAAHSKLTGLGHNVSKYVDVRVPGRVYYK